MAYSSLFVQVTRLPRSLSHSCCPYTLIYTARVLTEEWLQLPQLPPLLLPPLPPLLLPPIPLLLQAVVCNVDRNGPGKYGGAPFLQQTECVVSTLVCP